MRAVRYYGERDVRCDKGVELPQGDSKGTVPADCVQLKVEFCGLCGSDLGAYLHEGTNTPVRKPTYYCSHVGPAILGHEFSGVVEAKGSGVKALEVGDRVAVLATLYCSKCPTCLAGLTHLCENRGFYGYSGLSGGFAETAIVQESHAFKLPKGMSGEAGALVEPLAVGWHAVKQGHFKQGNQRVMGRQNIC